MKIIEPATPEEFKRYYDLRWRILRAPWNQPRGSERDELDGDSIHLMVIAANNRVIGVGRLHFTSIREAQIRYMAIEVAQQRKGAGTLLLQALEDRAGRLGAAISMLNARETALRFYRNHGYSPDGPGPVLYKCITHIKMSKTLEAK